MTPARIAGPHSACRALAPASSDPFDARRGRLIGVAATTRLTTITAPAARASGRMRIACATCASLAGTRSFVIASAAPHLRAAMCCSAACPALAVRLRLSSPGRLLPRKDARYQRALRRCFRCSLSAAIAAVFGSWRRSAHPKGAWHHEDSISIDPLKPDRYRRFQLRRIVISYRFRAQL